MARSKTTFQAGRSGNPGGRPAKRRALTDILTAAGNAKCRGPGGDQVARKKLLADMIWQALIAGEVTLHGEEFDRTLQLRPNDWFDMVRWLYAQVDGDLAVVIKEEPEETKATDVPQAVIYLPDNGREAGDSSDGK